MHVEQLPLAQQCTHCMCESADALGMCMWVPLHSNIGWVQDRCPTSHGTPRGCASGTVWCTGGVLAAVPLSATSNEPLLRHGCRCRMPATEPWGRRLQVQKEKAALCMYPRTSWRVLDGKVLLLQPPRRTAGIMATYMACAWGRWKRDRILTPRKANGHSLARLPWWLQRAGLAVGRRFLRRRRISAGSNRRLCVPVVPPAAAAAQRHAYPSAGVPTCCAKCIGDLLCKVRWSLAVQSAWRQQPRRDLKGLRETASFMQCVRSPNGKCRHTQATVDGPNAVGKVFVVCLCCNFFLITTTSFFSSVVRDRHFSPLEQAP